MIRLPLPIATDHPAFAGHFPGWPIVPGVVLLDESLRAIGARRQPPADVPCRIASAKFLSFVTPGEPVHLECEDLSSASVKLRVVAGIAPTERIAMTCSVAYSGLESPVVTLAQSL